MNLTNINADLWVFDNDGTLYSNTQKIKTAVESLMVDFIAKEYTLSRENAIRYRQRLLDKYNTKYTAVAIKSEGVAVSRFIRETYLRVNPRECGMYESPELQRLLSTLGGKKVVLTNNPAKFAQSILQALGINAFFSKIIGMEEIGFIQKPDKRVFSFLKKYLQSGKKVVVIDDVPANTSIAKELGCFSILVGNKPAEKGFYDLRVRSLV